MTCFSVKRVRGIGGIKHFHALTGRNREENLYHGSIGIASSSVLTTPQKQPAPTNIKTDEPIGSSPHKEVEGAMTERKPLRFTRQQLYEEVWEHSVSGVAKRYNIPYGPLLKRLHSANIPIPPSGYWTKLSFAKIVEKPELTGAGDQVVEFFGIAKEPQKKRQASSTSKETSTETNANKDQNNIKTNVPIETSDTKMSEAETVEQFGQTYNVYERETLYKEVWERPVTQVAKKYQVSDVAIRKVCKSLNVPTPPLGYWAKLRAGKPVNKPQLPEEKEKSKKLGIRSEINEIALEKQSKLEFLRDDERNKILLVADQLVVQAENVKMHASIIAYRKMMASLLEKNKRTSQSRYVNYRKPPPRYLEKDISESGRLRAYRIIDSLIKAMQPLGCSLTEELDFVVKGETVGLSFSESTDKVPHVLTRDEHYQMLEYEESRKNNSYASKPQIRKYDYVFNGRLTVSVNGRNYYRDCNSYSIEDKVGNLIIELYENAEQLRKAKLRREEAERIRQEELRQKELQRERYNDEVDRTICLRNEAKDYEIACSIRRFVDAIEKQCVLDEQTVDYLKWARLKADWYDPIVAHKDEFFGERNHKDDEKNKEPKTRYW